MSDPRPRSSTDVHCCIVGAGPAGAVLAFILARRGLRVALLEAADDFDRDFRGDTIHPSMMEIMAELGLASAVERLGLAQLSEIVGETPGGPFIRVDLHRLRTPYPYITMLPQRRFLDFLTDEAATFQGFDLRMGAHANELLEAEDGRVVGVRYKADDGVHEIRAALTVGTDGRGSTMRRLGKLDLERHTPPMDVLWLRLDRDQEGEPGIRTVIDHGHMLVMLDRGDDLQVAYVVRKGSIREVRDAGIDALRASIVETVPELGQALASIEDWDDVSSLSVQAGRVKRWQRPGLLLIGDAAHVMTPAGGIGINIAVQDAVVTANVVARPLEEGRLTDRHLRAVQRRRALPVWAAQLFQRLVQRAIVSPALAGDSRPPWFLGLPIVRDLPGRFIGIGLWRVHVKV